MKQQLKKLALLAVAAAIAIGAPHAVASLGEFCFEDCPRVDAHCPGDCMPWNMWSVTECSDWPGLICCECWYGVLYCQCPDGSIQSFGFQGGRQGPGICLHFPNREGCIFTGEVKYN
ncbi:MAG: hypothetical protein KatS3mg015_0319 [Fimbriimonadales bacterium]|jgi:hypothetical protein|nr:MAG: hypothetical protein KatS3mg015_0319 [Fimbriimonadales bacterium]